MATPDPRRWYHLIFTTYGAWLPGDPRGFRTRRHREHVEGDYRRPPPPGLYEGLHRAARATLKKPPVTLSAPLRSLVGRAVKDRFDSLGALVVCLAVLRSHVHLLAKLPGGEIRRLSGAAKRHAWFVIRDHGWSGRLWGHGLKIVSIRDRRHQLCAFKYIVEHKKLGAWVWKWGEEWVGESADGDPGGSSPRACD